MKHYFFINLRFYYEVTLFIFRIFLVLLHRVFRVRNPYLDDWTGSCYYRDMYIVAGLLVLFEYHIGYDQAWLLEMSNDLVELTLDSKLVLLPEPLFDCWLFVLENNYSQPLIFFIP